MIYLKTVSPLIQSDYSKFLILITSRLYSLLLLLLLWFNKLWIETHGCDFKLYHIKWNKKSHTQYCTVLYSTSPY